MHAFSQSVYISPKSDKFRRTDIFRLDCHINSVLNFSQFFRRSFYIMMFNIRCATTNGYNDFHSIKRFVSFEPCSFSFSLSLNLFSFQTIGSPQFFFLKIPCSFFSRYKLVSFYSIFYISSIEFHVIFHALQSLSA